MAKVLVNKLGVFGGQLSRRSVCMAVSCRVPTDDTNGAAVCTHHSSLQQIVWHTNIMGGENSAPLPSNATDANDGAAVCNDFSN